MTAIALGSVKGAPGVTTTMLAMAAVWPTDRRLLVAELDPDGGVLAARRGLGFEPGLVTAVAALLRGAGAVHDHIQALSDSVGLLVAPSTAEQVRASVDAAGDALWAALATDDDVLIDCGRLRASSSTSTLARNADTLLLLLRPRLEDVALARDRVPSLRRSHLDPRLVLVDDGPYRTDEVVDVVGVPVLARLPMDLRTADALNGVTAQQRLARSRLLRSVRAMVDGLLAVEPQPHDRPVPADRA
jgi:cellulose biosynthesis protein BcsQ